MTRRLGIIVAAVLALVAPAAAAQAAPTHYLRIAPAAATAPDETHAVLVTSGSITKPTAIHVEYQNQAQLRTGSAPNPWEVGWVLFNFTGLNHFYYVALKTNGWEIGKEYEAGGVQQQQFLATGTTPTAPIGAWLKLDVTASYTATAVTMTVKAKIGAAAQVTLATITDDGTSVSGPALQSGSVGAYTEDARVDFGWIRAKVGTATPLDDDFHTYPLGSWAEGSVHGPWTVQFNGGGSTSITT
jgi:hypothetical protein